MIYTPIIYEYNDINDYKDLFKKETKIIIFGCYKQFNLETFNKFSNELKKCTSNNNRTVLVNAIYRINDNIQQKLLSHLESPPQNTLIILITDNVNKLNITLLSRIKILYKNDFDEKLKLWADKNSIDNFNIIFKNLIVGKFKELIKLENNLQYNNLNLNEILTEILNEIKNEKV